MFFLKSNIKLSNANKVKEIVEYTPQTDFHGNEITRDKKNSKRKYNHRISSAELKIKFNQNGS